MAVIPARGDSKRIPRKNIRPLRGQPIISYAITAALSSKIFNEVMVSTEDSEIAQIALSLGAKVPFMRSKETAKDSAILVDVLQEVLNAYSQIGLKFDFLCCILPTALFISADDLKKSGDLFLEAQADAVISVVRFSFPIQRAFRMTGNRLSMIWPENMHKHSQELERTFHDAGQFYWIRPDVLDAQGKLFADYSLGYELPESQVQDIDTEEDWKIAESKFTQFLKKHDKP